MARMWHAACDTARTPPFNNLHRVYNASSVCSRRSRKNSRTLIRVTMPIPHRSSVRESKSSPSKRRLWDHISIQQGNQA